MTAAVCCFVVGFTVGWGTLRTIQRAMVRQAQINRMFAEIEVELAESRGEGPGFSDAA